MHEKFREGVLDKIVEHAFQHPALQQNAEALAQWARETYGAPLEKGHDPMLTIAYRAVRLIAEYQQQRAERMQAMQRKSAPSTALPMLPSWMIASAQASAGSAKTEEDANEVKGTHATALLGTYASGRYPFLCHQDCLSLLEYAHFHEIRLIDREGYASCDGCGFPVAGPSFKEWGLYPPLLVPADFVGIIYRVQHNARVVAKEISRPSTRADKSAPQQLSLFESDDLEQPS